MKYHFFCLSFTLTLLAPHLVATTPISYKRSAKRLREGTSNHIQNARSTPCLSFFFSPHPPILTHKIGTRSDMFVPSFLLQHTIACLLVFVIAIQMLSFSNIFIRNQVISNHPQLLLIKTKFFLYIGLPLEDS
jgi:hypothetical protein